MKRKPRLTLLFGNGTNHKVAFAAAQFLEQEASEGRLIVAITVPSALRLIFDLLRQTLTARRSNAIVTVQVVPSIIELGWLNESA